MSEMEFERLWEAGWDGHRRAQQRRLATLSFADKLQWLEEAQILAEQLRKSRNQAPRDGARSGAEPDPQG